METRLLSNMLPMYKGFKEGIWRHLMETIKKWTREYVKLHIIVGPVFDHDSDGLADTNITR